jgi:glycosyltransferase involved in cell wall biosynthesis
MRTAALMHYLSSKYRLDAIFFRQQGDADPRDSLPPGLVRRTLLADLPEHSRSPVRRLTRNVRRAAQGVPPLVDRFSGHSHAVAEFCKGQRYEVAVIEHFWCADYHWTLGEFADATVLDLHNVESQLARRTAEVSPWPLSLLHQRFGSLYETLEREYLPCFDHVLVPSQADRNLVMSIQPKTDAAVYPNTLADRPIPAVKPRQQVVFAANFEYHPNRDAANWLLARIWPQLAARHPGLELVMLGRNPHTIERHASKLPRVRITGPVEDAAPELSASLVSLVPLRSGSGTRLKIIESWAAGVPVVSTSLGAEGLPAIDGGNILLADTAGAFAERTTGLIASVQLRETLRTGGRMSFETEFTWESGWRKLELAGI